MIQTTHSRWARRTRLAAILLVLVLVLTLPTNVLAANPAPVQVYYLTLPEGDALTVLDAINTAATPPVSTYFSIAIGVNGTYVYYDQWENGYDSDIANPANLYSASNPGGTQIWGNGKAADGCAPNKKGVTFACTDANDVLHAGDVIIPYNTVDLTLTPQYDVLDRFSAVAYNNNDGTNVWSSNWVEMGDGTTGASSGKILVTNNQLRFTGTIATDRIDRGVSIQPADCGATLSFTLSWSGVVFDGNDEFRVLVSSNGGSTYTTLATFGTSAAPAASQSFSLGSTYGANTRVQFYSVDPIESGKYWAVDDVRVAWGCARSSAGEPLFDGKDKIGASSSIAMARAVWAAGSGTLNAFGHEMYPTAEWGTAYEAPVGTNTANAGQMFEYSALSIMAAQNGTPVRIDADANGVYETTATLNEGGSLLVPGVRQGARVESTDPTKPIQVVLVTGDIGSSYASRDMNLLPVSTYGSAYWSPVGVNTGRASPGYTPTAPVRLYLYNPSAGGNIYITCERYGAANVTLGPVAPRGVVTTDLVNNQGARCYASTVAGAATSDKIFAIGTVDTTGTAGDWSFTLYPDDFLSTEALVGLGLGKDPTNTISTENSSPLWVTAACSAGGTYVYVDWNNDGTPDKVDFNGNGNVTDTNVDGLGLNETTSDQGFLVTRLLSVRLYNPTVDVAPYDQSGARVWSRTTSGVGGGGTPGCNLALAWGQDPRTATAAAPGLDVGTSIPPLRLIEGAKRLELKTDADSDGVLSPGDTATYYITVKNAGGGAVSNVYVYDAAVPTNTDYVPNSTQKDIGSGWTAIPDDATGTPFPLDVTGTPNGVLLGASLPANTTWTVRFDVTLKNIAVAGVYEEITNCDIAYTGGGTVQSCTTNLVASNDWGDLPDTYGTSLAANGPRHSLSASGLKLGAYIDRDLQGQPSANADGDDLNQTTPPKADDEDGIVITGNQGWQTGAGAVRVTVTNGPGCLNGWLDFTNDSGATPPSPDGNFTRAGGGYDTATVSGTTYSEHFIQNVKVETGTTNLTVSAPPGVFSGASGVYFRFRLSPPDGSGNCTAPIGPTGFVAGGEVEDYYITPVDLAVTKTDGLTTVTPGQTIVYTINIRNAGPGTATGVTLADTIGAYLTYQGSTCPGTPTINGSTYTWSFPNPLPAGQSTSCTVTVKVATSLPNGTTNLSNYAYVSASALEVNITNNEVSDINQVTAQPDLTIAKAITSPLPPGKNSTVAYRLSGGNIGYATATNVTIVDTLDSQVTYNTGSATLTVNGSPASLTVSYDNNTKKLTLGLPNLAPGATYVLTYTGTVSDNPGTTLVNTAVISETETDANTTDNTATLSVVTSQDRDVYVLKSAVANPAPAVPGGQIVYTLAYGNNGTENALNVKIEDTIPANTTLVTGSITGGGTLTGNTITWNLETVNGGTSGTVGFTVQIVNPLPAGVGAIANTATISTTSQETNTSNNTSTASTPVTAQPDLRVTKDDGKAQVLAGERLTYAINYSNVGNQGATGVAVVDTLPANVTFVSSMPSTPTCSYSAPTLTCNVGNLAAGASGAISVVVDVKSDLLAGAVVLNRASIDDDRANGADPNLADNSATDSDTVIAPYLVLEKSASGPSPVNAEVTYAIYWRNNSAATATDVQITDTLPANTTLVASSISDGGTYNESTRTITWNLDSQAPGASGTVSFRVTLSAGAGNAPQTTPTLSTKTGAGSVTVVSKTTPYGSLPWCDSAYNPKCLTYRGLYQAANGIGPTGWADNPRATLFDDGTWTHPITATAETFYWLDASVLNAEWTSVHTTGEVDPNYSFFRQAFCLPLNAGNLDATLKLASDDVSTIYLNGINLGQHTGAGGYSTLAAGGGIQSGINILAVRLLNNSHGGHPFPTCPGCDHSGLLFNLQASYGSLRPFASAPAMALAGQSVTIAVDENALGGRTPYSYKFDFGDGTVVDFQSQTSQSHQYSTPGVYVATVTARAQYGCTGTDQVTITVLPSGSNLLANPANVTYRSATGNSYSGQSGAGILLAGAIGDRVWLDEDSDGVQDAGEAGIANVKVELVKGGNVVATTYTDANGNYVFTNVPAGAYDVRVDISSLPAGLAANPTFDYDGLTTQHSATVTVAAGQKFVLADFGYNWAAKSDVNNGTGTGAIGDRVWIDANGNGVQDANEAGIQGVEVQLWYDSDGDGMIDSQRGSSVYTNATGNYIFDDLPAGIYEVRIPTVPNGYIQTGDPDRPGVPCTTCDNKTTTPIVLAPGDVYVNADFGYMPQAGYGATIGTQIWLDADGNGILGSAEPGIPRVTVALIQDTNGNGLYDPGTDLIIATAVTDANGYYEFSGLPVGGNYLVWVNDTHNVLAGLRPTHDSDDIATANISAVSALKTDGDQAQDFGYMAGGYKANKGLIGNTVFLDLNGNGRYDAGEGLEGVTVRLYADRNGDGNYDVGEPAVAQATTDENGNYYFANLPAGNYVVVVDTTTLPPGVTNTVDPDTTDSPLHEAGVALMAGEINLLQDFGYQGANSISGTVWTDADADGFMDEAETGWLAGVTVVLRDSNGNVVARAVTDGNGNYTFANLPDGTYTVDVTDAHKVLDGYWKSDCPTANCGQNGYSQSDPYPVTVNGTVGRTNDTADFGYYRQPAALGDRVWYDLNGNGAQDTGEPGIAGAVVSLTITWPNNTGTTVVKTTTDADGNYTFGNLLLDENMTSGGGSGPSFSISVATPSDSIASLPTQLTANVTKGLTDNTYDFGFYQADWGDAPDSYKTSASTDGPRHILYPDTNNDGLPDAISGWPPAVWLGAVVDRETDGKPSSGATGDDSDKTRNDEDGITAHPSWNTATSQLQLPVQVASSLTGDSNKYYLGIWIDWNRDGVFNPAAFGSGGEMYLLEVSVGSNTVNMAAPAGFNGDPALEFRLRLYPTDPGTPLPTGLSLNGEVEDHIYGLSPLAVTLAFFTAQATADGVTLAWETVSETDNAGFNVYRGESEAGPWIKLSDTLIPAAAPGSSEGHAYTWTDATVEPGATYWYLLEDVALDGTATQHPPVQVTLGEPNAVGLAGFRSASLAAVPFVVTALAILAALAGAGLYRRR